MVVTKSARKKNRVEEKEYRHTSMGSGARGNVEEVKNRPGEIG